MAIGLLRDGAFRRVAYLATQTASREHGNFLTRAIAVLMDQAGLILQHLFERVATQASATCSMYGRQPT
jgi:hypothetical protein